MAYHQHSMSATYVPGMDDYYAPPAPELIAPEPQRINPEIGNQMADGLHKLDLNSQGSRASPYSNLSRPNDGPHLSPFPKLVNPPANVPPSDEDLEATLENARTLVLSSNDPEMQLAWAADALVYVGVCADNEERIAAAKPHSARAATPRIEHQLKKDSMNITTFLADQHHPKAEFLKGMWLEWGRFGQREDKKEAFRCYSRAADRGYARAEYRIGMLYESYNDPIKALRHYNRGVDAQDAASCYRLGMMTLRGQHGQPQDYRKGLELIRKSADTADENAAQGAYVYGMLLARQLPQIEIPDGYLPSDEPKARMNIEKAAYLKFAKAQLKMGSAHELCTLGCEFNPALSVHYNALAAKQGEAEADMALSKWFLVGSDGLFPKNEELAYTYAERASQSGLATAEFALGYFNEIGMYVPVSLDRAMEWYQKASQHGNADAEARIEGLSKKQVLSKKDHENVAISRIKSQHGSMRGQRPDRFQQQQQQQPRLDQVPESPTSVYSQAVNGHGAPQPYGAGVMPPARGTTPYPESNDPPVLPPVDIRAQNITPYPLEDGPPRQPRLGPTGGFFSIQQPPRPSTTLNPDLRPSSAFQISPDLRSNSAQPQPRPPYAGARPYAGGPPAGPGPNYRPATTQPYDPRGRPLVGNRVGSGPAVVQQQPHQSTPSPAPIRPLQHTPTAPVIPPSQQQQKPMIDIGFSAPPDDRRRQYGPSRLQQERPPLQSSNSMPNFDQPAPLKPHSRPPDGRKPESSSTPKTTSNQSAAKPPVATPAPAAAAGAKPSAAAPANRPPGKGPKTFDEMGVPQTKEENCVVM